MRVSIIDTIFPIGHKELNNKLLSLIPKVNMDILVSNNDGFFNEEEISKVIFKDFNLIGQQKNYFVNIVCQIFNYLIIWSRLYGRKDEIKLFLTFENISFAIARLLFSNSRNVIFHHNNTDYLTRRYVRFFFKTYMNAVHHIVFADFIKERLIEIGVKEKNIFVLTHPILKDGNIHREEHNDNIFIGLGYASDENFFRKIIEFENEFQILKKNRVKLILRSSNLEYNSDNITFIKGHLSLEEYTNLNCRATGILFLYPKNYKYRYSGAIIDALRFKKIIIGANIPIVMHFKGLYPNLCYSYDTIEELFTIIVDSKFRNHDDDYHNVFLKNHDDSNVKHDFEKILFSE